MYKYQKAQCEQPGTGTLNFYIILTIFLLVVVVVKKNFTRTMVAFVHYALPSTIDLQSSDFQLLLDI